MVDQEVIGSQSYSSCGTERTANEAADLTDFVIAQKAA